MKKPNFNYDEISDTLYVSFEPGEKATGIELNEHILLRINKNEHRAIGLTFLDYSLLAQETEIGRRSFPLIGLSELSEELRESVIDILQKPPVNKILHISAYTPSIIETIPISVMMLKRQNTLKNSLVILLLEKILPSCIIPILF